MADYYYEARKHDKWLRKHAKENKARKERMKQFQRTHSRDHHQSLIIEGNACKLYRDPAAGAVVEAALMPWNGRRDVLIDRFDARAVLDMVPLSPKDTGDHREKKGLETFLSFERYRGIVDAQRVGLGEEEHAFAVSEQVQDKLSEIARFKKGEPDEAEIAAAKDAQEKRNKKAEDKAALKEAKNAGVQGHYGPGGGGAATATGTAAAGGLPSRGRGAEVALKYGGDVVGGKSGGGGGRGGAEEEAAVEQDEDEAQLDPEILALIEKEVGGGAAGSDRESSEESDFTDDDDDEEDIDEGEEHKADGGAQALWSAQDRFAEAYGISEKRSGYSYSRLLRYERRHRAQHRANRAEEMDAAKKRKRPKKKADAGTAGLEDDDPGTGGGRRGGSRLQLGSSVRDSPTYDDFGDPLEARRKKRREDREKAGVSRDAAGNGAGRGRQYISSFEVADSKPSGGNSGSGSDGSLLDSDSDGDDGGGGGGGSHLVLLENFFPTLADSLRKHLEIKEAREKELEAERERERERDREREIERARRRAAARRRSRSSSSSRHSGSRRGSSRDRGERGRRSRGRDSRSRSRGRSSSSSSRRRYRNGDGGRERSGRGSGGGGGESSSRSGKTGSGSKQTKAPPTKGDKKLTPMEMMKLRMRKALDSQLQKDKTAIAKKSSKESKMAELDRKQQRLDEEQHERLQSRAKDGGDSPSRSRSRSPPRRSRRSRSRSSSRDRASKSRRRDSRDRDGRGRGHRGSSSGGEDGHRRRQRRRSSRSSSGSRSRSVSSHRGSSSRSRGGDVRRKDRRRSRDRESEENGPGKRRRSRSRR